MNKAILLSDVKQVKDKYICFDEDYTCPLFNREKWKCQYRINTKTKDCPLRPLPKKQVEQKYDIASEYDQYYVDEYATGWNDCLDEITGRKKNDRN